jgi:hypothetical protein
MGKRLRLAEIFPEMDNLNPSVLYMQLLQNIHRAVRTAVVHKQQLKLRSNGLQDRAQPLIQFPQALLFIIAGNDDTDINLDFIIHSKSW